MPGSLTEREASEGLVTEPGSPPAESGGGLAVRGSRLSRRRRVLLGIGIAAALASPVPGVHAAMEGDRGGELLLAAAGQLGPDLVARGVSRRMALHLPQSPFGKSGMGVST